MKISIVIPNYNGEGLLRRNLSKIIHEIKKLRNREVEIIIVDDCSKDNSVAEIKNQRAGNTAAEVKIKLIENSMNLGFSSSVNIGVKEAEGEIVILMNTDIYPEGNFIEPLLFHFANPKIFAVGMMDKSIEGENIVRRGRGVAWWEKGFLLHRRGEIEKTDTFWASGGSSAFRRSVWLKIGGFDEIYNPFYWEDIDLSYRARKAGYRIIFEPRSIIVHDHLKGAIKQRFSEFQIKTIAYRNQFFFVWINITEGKLLLSHLFWLPIHLVNFLIKADFAFCWGLVKAILKLPQALKSRNNVKKLFYYKDQEVLNIRR